MTVAPDPSPPPAPRRIGVDPGQPWTARDEELARAARTRVARQAMPADPALPDVVDDPGWELRVSRDALSLLLIVAGLAALVACAAVAFGALPGAAAAGAAVLVLGYLLST